MILSGFVTSGWFRVVVVLIYIFNWQAGFRNGIFDSMGVPGGGGAVAPQFVEQSGNIRSTVGQFWKKIKKM
jgi:hypothetical protein